MGTEWQFENVEHLFREHAKSRGVTYDPDKPLAALDNGAVKRASELLGAKTWADFAALAHVSARTMQKWGTDTSRATVEASVFPALCDVAATPYKARREAYENSSAWLPQYIEESVAHALIDGTETPEDTASDLSGAWERYNVATLLLAAFTLTGEKLETVANVARGTLTASGAKLRTQKPYPSRSAAKNLSESEQITSEAETIEREAIFRVPERSAVSIDFSHLKQLTDERSAQP
jgi:hypothetical protein